MEILTHTGELQSVIIFAGCYDRLGCLQGEGAVTICSHPQVSYGRMPVRKLKSRSTCLGFTENALSLSHPPETFPRLTI